MMTVLWLGLIVILAVAIYGMARLLFAMLAGR